MRFPDPLWVCELGTWLGMKSSLGSSAEPSHTNSYKNNTYRSARIVIKLCSLDVWPYSSSLQRTICFDGRGRNSRRERTMSPFPHCNSATDLLLKGAQPDDLCDIDIWTSMSTIYISIPRWPRNIVQQCANTDLLWPNLSKHIVVNHRLFIGPRSHLNLALSFRFWQDFSS